MGRAQKTEVQGLESDLAHVRETLERVHNPQYRYQLTMLLEMAAQQFIRLEGGATTAEENKHEGHSRAPS
jgi:hypothetical protein